MDLPSSSCGPNLQPKSQFWSKNYVSGLFFLGIVVFLWTLSNFVTQDLFRNGFRKPFLVTYLNTASFALYFLSYLWRRRQGTTETKHSQNESVLEATDSGYQPLLMEPEAEQVSVVVYPPLTIKETSNLALAFCLLWFIANWTVNASLFYTSVASATILSSTSGLFTLAIGTLFKVEELTATKIIAVLLSFGGVILVALSDSSHPEEPMLGRFLEAVLGDVLALTSAIFYALYTTLLKLRIRTESRIDMQLFFGFVGLYNIFMCWILGVVLHVTGVERFELPHTNAAIGAILLNMFITFTSDYLYVLAMLKTTPVVVTVGLSLTIPLAVIGDVILGRHVYLQVLFGALLVSLGFVLVGCSDS